MATSLLLKNLKQETAALAAATVATAPPAKANMVDVTTMRQGNGAAPRLARLVLKGGQAGAQDLSAGLIWGWDKDTDLPVQIGQLNDGATVTITNARFFGQLLADVLGCYTHIGVTGTLTASTLIIEVAPVETQDT